MKKLCLLMALILVCIPGYALEKSKLVPHSLGSYVASASIEDVRDGLVLDYDFEGVLSALPRKVHDQSAGGYEGTVTGNAVRCNGPGALRGMKFDGSSGYIDTKSMFQPVFKGPNGGFTISAWIRPVDGQPASAGAICGSRESVGTDDVVALYLNTNGTIVCSYIANDNAITATTGVTYKDGSPCRWVNAVFVVKQVSATNAQATIYIDGKLAATGASAACVMNEFATPYTLYVGAYNSVGVLASVLNGDIASCRIYNRVLTVSEIAQLYAYQRQEAGL